MRLKDSPLNLNLMHLLSQDVAHISKITSLDIYDNSGISFHEDGLYSIQAFGQLGSPERDNTFAYIDLKTKIIHPFIFKHLCRLKNTYLSICAGHSFGKWDPVKKDIVTADAETGETGYDFFFRHWNKIEFQQTGSDKREARIELINKYRKEGVIQYHLVAPAGMRDIQVDDVTGNTKEDEINGFYLRLLSSTNVMDALGGDHQGDVYNAPRWSMQRAANDLYDYIISKISGKRGWAQSKYGSRTTVNGTANVVTAMNLAAPVLGADNAPGAFDTMMGFTQCLRGALPYTLRGMSTGILGETMNEEGLVWLVNRKTLRREMVELTNDSIDLYAIRTGHEKLINRFFNRKQRNRTIIIEGYYLGLIYIDDSHFKVFNDIEELPEHLSRKNVHPMTLTDLLYVSTIEQYRKLVGTMTRYPITGDGSIYPTYYKIRTTVRSYTKTQLDDNWEPNNEKVFNFPDRSDKAVWMDSLSPHTTRLQASGGDFDGDRYSSPILYLSDSINEIEDYFNTRASLIGLDDQLLISPNTDNVLLTVANMTFNIEDIKNANVS